MAFKEYFDLDDIKLVLPIRGKEYSIPPVSADGGVQLEAGEDLTAEEFLTVLLGAALTEMREDKVPDLAIERAAFVAYTNHHSGIDVAKMVWETGQVPKAPTPATVTPEGSETSTDTASENAIPSPASTKTTTSRPATPRPKKSTPKPPRSRGPRSSAKPSSSKPTSGPSTSSN